MREFLLSVFASIVAAIILLVSGPISHFFVRDDVYLDVDVQQECMNQLTITTIRAHNSSRYGFDPLIFRLSTEGDVVRLVIKSTSKTMVYLPPVTNHFSVPTTIGSGESMEIIEIAENGSLTRDVQKLFSGEYSVIGQRGMVEHRPIAVRTTSAAQMALYLFAGKIAAIVIVLIGVLTTLLLLRKKWTAVFKRTNI